MKYRIKRFFLNMIVTFGLGVMVGCSFSDAYHLQVFMGNAEPRPYPMMRFYAEYSKDDFLDNVLALPMVGIPGVIPFGYVMDLCWDTLFLPIDLTLSLFMSEPQTEVLLDENGKCEIRVYTTTAQLHRDKTQIKGRIPVEVHVEQGDLSIEMKTSSLTSQMTIKPQEVIFTSKDCRGVKRYKVEEEAFILWCAPPYFASPPFLVFSLFSPQTEAPSVVYSLYQDVTKRPMARSWMSMYKEKWCEIKFIPSRNFVGTYSYKGQQVSKITFIYD